VLWAASAIDITNDIVKLYDQANPGTGTAKAPGAAAPAAPKPAGTTPATNPLAPAPKKK
jgi:outer membrane protein